MDEALRLKEEELDALNRHGVFFKKRVLEEIRRIQGVQILAEELGVRFGGTRVIDLVAYDAMTKPQLIFILECKRAYTERKRWIFFHDVDRYYRVARVASALMGTSNVFERSNPPEIPVCSEGYEYSKTDQNRKGKADQNPIFQAAAQLAAGYCGLIDRRLGELNSGQKDIVERYVPVLVTNAELLVVQGNFRAVSLEDGRMPSLPEVIKTDFLILKQPFPTPTEMHHIDFRDVSPQPAAAKFWAELHKESIYVLAASALGTFFSVKHREFLREAKSLQ